MSKIESYLSRNIKKLHLFYFFIFLVASFFFFQFTVDDSYITFRYAKNFLDNGIWNWNPNDDLVECYTSTSYAILSLIPISVNFEPHIFFKFIGLIIGITILKRIISLKLNYLNELSLIIIFFANPFFYFHLFSGLETPLFLYLIFESLIYLEKRHLSKKIFYTILFCLPATRPEGIIFSTFFLIYDYSIEKNIKNKKFLFFLILIGIIYFIIRLFYFEKILPNTFYHKSIDGFSLLNIINIYTFNRSIFYIIIILACVPLIKNANLSPKKILIPFIIVFLFYLSSRLSMNYAERFFLQIFLPLIAFFFIIIKKNKIYFIFILSLLYSTTIIKNKEEILHLISYKPRMTSSYEALGKELSKYSNSNVKVAMSDVGILPYYSNLVTYDIIGLCHNNNKTLNFASLKKINPSIMIFLSYGPEEKDIDKDYKWQKDLLAYKNYLKQKAYYAGSLKINFNRYLAIYVNEDTDQFEKIIQDIKKIESNNNRIIDWKNYLKFKYL